MKPISPIRFLTGTLVILMLALLSACSELSVQIVTATQQTATLLADTNTPAPTATTQVGLPSATEAATASPAVSATTASTKNAPQSTTAVTIETIRMKDANNGWAIGIPSGGTSDRVLSTQDGGKTWTNITPPHAFDVIGTDNKSAIASFSNTGSAWAFFFNKDMTPLGVSSAVIWNTTNSGQTWTASQPLDLGNIQMAYFKPSDLVFSDAQHGWTMIHLDAGMMHDYVTIFATSDGGLNWKEIVDPTGQNLTQSFYKNGMAFIDANTGWIAGDFGGVQAGVFFYKTTDGGLTWTNRPLPAPAASPTAFTDQNACSASTPQFVTATDGFTSVKCNFMNSQTPTTTSWPYVTQDGGATWTVLSPLPSPLGTLFFLDKQTGWFLGASTSDPSTAEHSLAQTTDGGKTWKQLVKPNWTGQMDFISAKEGWLVASDGTNLALVKTSDGGITWQQLNAVVITN